MRRRELCARHWRQIGVICLAVTTVDRFLPATCRASSPSSCSRKQPRRWRRPLQIWVEQVRTRAGPNGQDLPPLTTYVPQGYAAFAQNYLTPPGATLASFGAYRFVPCYPEHTCADAVVE